MYGDFIQKSQGSLQNLAAELHGRVVSGPAASSDPTNASNASPSVPSQAHIANHPGTPVPLEDVHSSRGSRPKSFKEQASSDERRTVQPAAPHRTASPQWIELCIRSGPNTYDLGEIDVAGTQTDHTVFEKIRQKYRVSRGIRRLFGIFTPHVVNGGEFVQVCKNVPPFRKTRPCW